MADKNAAPAGDEGGGFIPRWEGLNFRKFAVTRMDGKDAPGGPKAAAEYFVMDYRHDPDAWASVASYVVCGVKRRPGLCRDLARRLIYVLPALSADPVSLAALRDIFGDAWRTCEPVRAVEAVAALPGPDPVAPKGKGG